MLKTQKKNKFYTKESLIFPCGMNMNEIESLPQKKLKDCLFFDKLAFAHYMFPNPTPEGREGLFDIKYGIPEFQKEAVDEMLNEMGKTIEWGLLVGPRGWGKGALLQIDSLWRIVYGQSSNLMYVTETTEASNTYLDFIKDELEMNTRIMQMFGQLKPQRIYDGTSKAWNMSKVVTATRRCVYSVGMRKRIRGNRFLTVRPDIYVDDAESNENTKNPVQMRKNLMWLFKDVIGATRDDSGWVLVSGNMLRVGCMVHSLSRNDDWTKRIYAAATPDLTESTWELKKPLQWLLKRKRMYEGSGDYETFYLEWMNDPKKASSKRFDPDDYAFWVGKHYCRELQYLIVEKIGRNFPNSTTIDWHNEQNKRIPVRFSMGIDLAFTEEEENDFNAFSINAIDGDKRVFGIETVFFKTITPSDITNFIIMKDEEYTLDNITIESIGAQRVVEGNLREECKRLKLTDLSRKINGITKHSDSKFGRCLGTLQPLMKQGKILFRCEEYMDTYKPMFPERIQQYDEFFPKMHPNDIIDADEMCISNMTAPMKVDSIYDVLNKSKGTARQRRLREYELNCDKRWILN